MTEGTDQLDCPDFDVRADLMAAADSVSTSPELEDAPPRGVLVEPVRGGGVVVVGVSGSALLVARDVRGAAERRALVSVEGARDLGDMSPSGPTVRLTARAGVARLSRDDDGTLDGLPQAARGWRAPVRPVDGTPPDWRSLVDLHPSPAPYRTSVPWSTLREVHAAALRVREHAASRRAKMRLSAASDAGVRAITFSGAEDVLIALIRSDPAAPPDEDPMPRWVADLARSR